MSFAKSFGDPSSKGATSCTAEKDLLPVPLELSLLHKKTKVRGQSQRGRKPPLGFKSSLDLMVDKDERIRVLQALIIFLFLGSCREKNGSWIWRQGVAVLSWGKLFIEGFFFLFLANN